MRNNETLVSVIIVTYNSSSTIIETLDSVKEQTYDNIELIVSDDNSTDNTVMECRRWMDENRYRFVHCEVVTSSTNTGVAPNANRGVRKSHGEWIKVLGGDDLFLPNAVEDVMNFVTPEKDIVVSQYNSFVVKDGKKVIGDLHPSSQTKLFYEEEDPEKRKQLIPHTFIEATIGYFIRKYVFDKVGGYDERYPMIEDVPMFFKLTQLGYKFHLLETPCFLYRIGESVTHVSDSKVYNVRFKESSYRFHREVVNKHISSWNIIYHQAHWMSYVQFLLIVKLAHNQNNYLSCLINKAIHYLTIKTYTDKIKGILR